jgi:hypothetical protein
MRLKLFWNNSKKEIETEVNTWLETNEANVSIITTELKYYTRGSCALVIAIWYKQY